MATATGQQIADSIDAELASLAAKAGKPIRGFARSVLVDAQRDHRSGRDPLAVIDRHLPALVQTLTQGMVAAHLTARRRIAGMAAEATPVLATVYDSAVAFLQARMLLSDEQVDDLAETYEEHAIVAAAEAIEPVQRAVGRALIESASAGLHVDEGSTLIREAFKAQGYDATPARVETLFRTQTQLAYAAGRDNAFDDPAIDEITWGYEYVTVGDDRVRPSHAALDGMRAPKDDPIWETHRPPNGFNCRCTIRAIFDGDPDATTQRAPSEAVVDGVTVKTGPDQGWDFAPGALFGDTISQLAETTR